MKMSDTELSGVKVITSEITHIDHRGSFTEAFHKRDVSYIPEFVQENDLYSFRGVIRGLHFEIGNKQWKLVSCMFGRIYDVAVCVRRSSPEFGNWVGKELGPKQGILIPPGFAHGFLTLEDSIVRYKSTTYFNGELQRGLAWDDPLVQVVWPDPGCAYNLSNADMKNRTLDEVAIP